MIPINQAIRTQKNAIEGKLAEISRVANRVGSLEGRFGQLQESAGKHQDLLKSIRDSLGNWHEIIDAIASRSSDSARRIKVIEGTVAQLSAHEDHGPAIQEISGEVDALKVSSAGLAHDLHEFALRHDQSITRIETQIEHLQASVKLLADTIDAQGTRQERIADQINQKPKSWWDRFQDWIRRWF